MNAITRQLSVAQGLGPSLKDVLGQVDSDPTLTLGRRRDLRSSLRALSEWFCLDLSAIAADHSMLRERFASFHPAQANVSLKRLQNVRSDVAFALERYGYGQRSATVPMSAACRALFDRLPDKYHRTALGRFFRFLSASGLAPEAVTDEVSQDFLASMETASLIRNPRETHKNMTRVWNKAVESVDGWPQRRLNEPRYRQTYGLRWEAFPTGLCADVDQWLTRQVSEDIFADLGPAKPLSPLTIDTQRDHLRYFASALVRSGHKLEDIDHLAYLVRPQHVREGLTFFLRRNGGKANGYISGIAYTLRTVALYGVDELSQSDRQEVLRLYRKVASRGSGLTPKNHADLRQFDDPATVARFLALPSREIDAVLRDDTGGVAEALRVQAALAIELWLFAPLRIANFAGLRLDEHLVWRGGYATGTLSIHVPADIVKNSVELEYEIPAHVVDHIRLYLERFRPRLVNGSSPWLWPGENSAAKHVATLRQQVKKAIRNGAGIRLTPHQFRHVGAKLFLDQNPGEYETVRRVLGHKSNKTTFSFYTGAEVRAAVRHYDTVLLRLTTEALAKPRDGGKR
jgi:integrase